MVVDADIRSKTVAGLGTLHRGFYKQQNKVYQQVGVFILGWDPCILAGFVLLYCCVFYSLVDECRSKR